MSRFCLSINGLSRFGLSRICPGTYELGIALGWRWGGGGSTPLALSTTILNFFKGEKDAECSEK